LATTAQPQPSAPTGKSTASTRTDAQSDLESQLSDLKSQLNAMKADLKHSQDQIDTLNKRKNR